MLRSAFVSFSARLLLVLPCLAFVGPAASQAYPTKPVRVVTGYSPGGPVDILGRLLTQRLSTSMGQPFVFENRSGAAGTIAADLVARSAPDGYTLLATVPSVFTIVPHTMEKVRVQASDFIPVVQFAEAPLVLVVNPSVPATTLKELTALLNAPGSKLSYASAGDGTLPHLAMEMLLSRTGGRPLHVPYKGSGPALQDLLGGQVDFMLDVLPSALPMIKAGRLRALAVTSRTRFADLPAVPTVAEAGVAGYEAVNWFGIFAPAATPTAITDKLRTEVEQAVAAKEMHQRLGELGAIPSLRGSDEVAERIKRESRQWGQLIQRLGLKTGQ